VIVGYRDSRTAAFAAGKRVKALSGIERPARLKLDRLEAAHELGDLAALPGNRFEALKGDRKGQYSIRINDQWRICFEWPDKSVRSTACGNRGLPLGEPPWHARQFTQGST
jgi:proteic killer suppression protein